MYWIEIIILLMECPRTQRMMLATSAGGTSRDLSTEMNILCRSKDADETYWVSVLSLTSACSKTRRSRKLWAYQELTSAAEGMRNRLSGSRCISFMMFARRTGSSLRRNTNDVRSHALRPGHNYVKRQVRYNVFFFWYPSRFWIESHITLVCPVVQWSIMASIIAL